jgi:hypothetical protein
MTADKLLSPISTLLVQTRRRRRLHPLASAVMPTSVMLPMLNMVRAPSDGRCRPIQIKAKSVIPTQSERSRILRNRNVHSCRSRGFSAFATVAGDFPEARNRRISSSTSGPQSFAMPTSPTRLQPAMRRDPIAVQEEMESSPSSPTLVYETSTLSTVVDFEVPLWKRRGRSVEGRGLDSREKQASVAMTVLQ